MLYIIMAILSSTSIFILFKLFNKYFIDTFHAIVINYFTAGLLGLLVFIQPMHIQHFSSFNWIILIIIIGVLFFLNFLLIQISTVKIGMATTSIACKVSVVIPIMFSIIYDSEALSVYKLLGIIGALLSIVLLTLRSSKPDEKNVNSWLLMFLPIVLFFGLGITDTMVKYVQQVYSFNIKTSTLTALFFTISFLSSLVWAMFKKDFLKKLLYLKNIIAGTLLGLFNFGSIFFLMMSLKNANIDHSIIFGIINLGIILLSVMIGFAIYKEKLSKLNLMGIIGAFASIILMSWNE